MAHETSPSVGPEDTIHGIYYAAYRRHELAEAIEPRLKEDSLDDFRKRLGFSEEDKRPQVDIKPIVSSNGESTKATCHNVLNAIVTELEGELSIRFRNQAETEPDGGPDHKHCRPSLIAYSSSSLYVDPGKQPISSMAQPSPSIDADYLAWTRLEVSAEFHSTDKTDEENLLQAVTYTAHHLLARPDRVVIPGFYIAPTYFYLILTGPSGACHTPKLEWTDDDHIELLRDFIYRIIKPSANMVDRTITRDDHGLFSITLKAKEYDGCQLIWIREPIGRRTTIFMTRDREVPIIKEQYLRSSPIEAETLEAIHKDCSIPGIVQIHDYNDFGEGEEVVACTIGKERRKVRMALIGTGDRFMDIQTPYEALVVIYDLLEVTRSIYRKAGILHRDISKGNILFQKDAFEPAKEQRDSVKNGTCDFCSALHLLDKRHPRERTPVLLIDFEHSIFYGEQKAGESAGTPVFVARAAAALEPIHPDVASGMSGMPVAPPLYADILSERLKRFPHENKVFIFEHTGNEAAKDWVHELRHDAESIFWLLLWWAIHVRPASSKSEPIWYLFWVQLTSRWVGRHSLLSTIIMESGWLHSGYKPLETLLQKMAKHLAADLHWVTDEHPKEMKEPEYVHETFQRHIFEFLVNNKDEPFMRQKRAGKNRVVENSGCSTGDTPNAQVNQGSSGSSTTRPSARANNSNGSKKRTREDSVEDDAQPFAKRQRRMSSNEQKHTGS